jgi:hypothetical protein
MYESYQPTIQEYESHTMCHWFLPREKIVLHENLEGAALQSVHPPAVLARFLRWVADWREVAVGCQKGQSCRLQLHCHVLAARGLLFDPEDRVFVKLPNQA